MTGAGTTMTVTVTIGVMITVGTTNEVVMTVGTITGAMIIDADAY